MDKYVIILAAGKGTRMKSELPKVLHKLSDRSMLDHVLDNVAEVEHERGIVVVGYGADQVVDSLPSSVKFWVEQKEQLGTGHAVMQTRDLLENMSGQTLVMYGDMPLITGETLNKLFDYHIMQEAQATVLTGIATDPFGYGRIIRENGEVARIVEEKDATKVERAIKEVNTGIYVFDNKLLFEALNNVETSNAQGEYYLTDVIEILRSRGHKIAAMTLENFDESLGINDRVQLAVAERILRSKINKKHMLAGVSLVDPETTYIGKNVEIGSDTVIEGNVTIIGETIIGKKCLITNGSRIVNSRLESGVNVNQSTVEGSTMERGSDIGPYGHLRPGTVLHEDVHIGNFVEIKDSTIGRRSKAGHLTYIGNATVGEKVNFGAGTITVNFDGKNKYRTEIDDFAFVGSNSTLIAPLHIGKNALTAAGSTITKDVADESVALGRTRQIDKLGLAKKLPHYKGE